MNALALVIPRRRSTAFDAERADEEDFQMLVESIETLLFTSADHPYQLDRILLAQAVAELEERWPEAASGFRPRIDARGRHRA